MIRRIAVLLAFPMLGVLLLSGTTTDATVAHVHA